MRDIKDLISSFRSYCARRYLENNKGSLVGRGRCVPGESHVANRRINNSESGAGQIAYQRGCPEIKNILSTTPRFD